LIRDQAVKSLSWQEANALVHDFNNLCASWVIPLFVKNELVGAIAFAASSPESIFDAADFQFFREFAEPVALSVKNALSFHELKVVNEQLQDVQSRLLQEILRQAAQCSRYLRPVADLRGSHRSGHPDARLHPEGDDHPTHPVDHLGSHHVAGYRWFRLIRSV